MEETFSDREERKPSGPLLRRAPRQKAWAAVLLRSWQTLLRVDRSQFTLATALRSSLGVFLPLIIGVMTGHIIEGVSLAAGAVGVGTIGLTYTYRARARTMLLACLAIAVSVLVGGLVGINDWLTVLVVALWGFGGGLLVAISPAATLVGLQATLALIVLTHFRLNPMQSLVQAGLILGGALFQAMLALIPSPWLRFGCESASISTAYEALADFVQAPEDFAIARQLNDSLLQAETIVDDNQSQGRSGLVLRGLLTCIERIHIDMLVLIQVMLCLQDGLQDELRQLMDEVAAALRSIAKSARDVTRVADVSVACQQIAVVVALLRAQKKLLCEGITPRQVVAYYMMLSRHLHQAEESVRLWQDVRRHPTFSLQWPRRPRIRLHDPLRILRSNLTLHSTACRHAIRLAIVLIVTTVLYRFSPLGRGYWVPVTALFVLKPDFSTTFTNSWMRSLGTILGAVVTSFLLILLLPGAELRAIMIGILSFLAFAFLNVNYTLFSLFVTALIVLILAFVDPQPAVTVLYRALDTAIGTSFALLAYILWPTWEMSFVREKFAARLDALQQYFVMIMHAFADPTRENIQRIEPLRRVASLTRSNAEASVERVLNEPAQRQGDPDIIYALFATTNNMAKALLALENLLQDHAKLPPLPELKPFIEEVSETLEKLSVSIRRGEFLDAPVKLTLHSLEESRKTVEARGGSIAQFELLTFYSANIVSCINTLNRLLSVHSGMTGQLAAPTS